MDKPVVSPLLQYVIGAGALVLIFAGMKAAAPVINLILLAFLLAFSVTPILRWLIKRKLSTGLAFGLTLLVVLVGGFIVLSLTAGSIMRLVDALPKYEGALESMKMSVLGLLESVGIDPSGLVPEHKYGPSELLAVAGAVLSVALDLLSNGLIIVLIMAFVLAELASLYASDAQAKRARSPLEERFLRAGEDVVRYVSITGWNGFLNAAANLVLLIALGVDFPVAWAFLSFLFNFVPNFGFILALIPPVLLAYLESGWLTAVLVIVGYVVLNFIAENILKPRTMKQGLEISPLLTILSVIVWTCILGPAGTILAVPLTVTLQKLAAEQTGGQS
jgi:AI-2 transport protein TqsA